MRINDSLKIALALIVLLIFVTSPVFGVIDGSVSISVNTGSTVYVGSTVSWTSSGQYTGYPYMMTCSATSCVSSANHFDAGRGSNASFVWTTSYNNWNPCWMAIVTRAQGHGYETREVYPVSTNTYNFAPVASYTVNETAFVGQVVYFTSTSTNSPTLYHWHYGNGDADMEGSTMTTTNKVYNFAGTYSTSLYVSNSGGNSTASKTVTVSYGSPTPAFTASPLTGPVPHTVTLTSQSTVPSGAPAIYQYAWTVTSPSGAVTTLADGSTTNFNANAMGYYTVEHTVSNAYGTVGLTKNMYIEAGLVPTPTPTGSWTPEPTQTPGPVQTYATIAPVPTGITPIFVPTDYRIAITNSSIGNLTVGYLNTVDNIGTTFKVIGVSVANVTGIPFLYVTPNIKTTVDMAGDLILSFAMFGHWVLVSLGVVISSLPAEIQGLVTLGLIYQILILAIKGKAAIT